jgi:predicted nucleic acid-binding protein
MRVLFDTDIVLDLVLERETFAEASASIFRLHERAEIEGYVSCITPVNVFYVTRKAKGIEIARQAVESLLASVGLCALDRSVLEDAQQLEFKDYEDAVQHASAVASRLDAIITRNIGDYKKSKLPVFTPTDFLNNHKAQESE